MNIVKWYPWREMETLQDRINRLFDDSFLPRLSLHDDMGLKDWTPAVDIYEEDGKIVVKAELPGMEKKDIKVNLEDHVLTLEGERSEESEEKKENYYRKERSFGKFHRSFTLPAAVDSEKVDASFKDGVLRVEIPMPEEKKPKKIDVH
jgi:HSP20 family protein